LVNYQKPDDLIGENGLLKQLNKMLVERALETEMTEHLGHGMSGAVTNSTGNTRTATVPRPCKAILVNCPWIFPATAKAHSSRNSLSSSDYRITHHTRINRVNHQHKRQGSCQPFYAFMNNIAIMWQRYLFQTLRAG
jgi:hypothetical protein